MIVFAMVAYLCHAVARVVAPFLYMPARYVLYSVPLLATIIVPTGVLGLLPRRSLERLAAPRRALVKAATAGCWCVAILLLVGGLGPDRAGLRVQIPSRSQIYRVIGELPKSALIAGWPAGAIENVPYISRRRALVTFETHLALHSEYVLAMRRRTRALIRAYFGTSKAALEKLAKEHGVTHLLVDLDLLSGRRRPRYFAPFERDIRRTLDEARGRRFAARELLDRLAVFREGRLALRDLSRL